MRRILLVAMLVTGGLLGITATANADIGDIQELSVDSNLFGSASEVDVTGTIDCQATVEYGLWVGVAQEAGGSAPQSTFFQDNTNPVTDDEEPVEGVGAYGPNFDPPVGLSDDSPCSQAVQPYDVIVQQNRDSGDFEGDDGGGDQVEVTVIAGTSAEDGDRGPGPFIGDMLGLDEQIDFERTR